MNEKHKKWHCDDGTYAASDRVIRNHMESKSSRDSPWLGFLGFFSPIIFLSAKVLVLAYIIQITTTLLEVLGCSDIVYDEYKMVLVGEWMCVIQERC